MAPDGIVWHMARVIVRVPEGLRTRLKQRAATEGRSLNALLNEVLEEAAPAARDRRTELDERIKAAGLWVDVPAPEGPVPSLDELIEANRGIGPVVVEEVLHQRRQRC